MEVGHIGSVFDGEVEGLDVIPSEGGVGLRPASVEDALAVRHAIGAAKALALHSVLVAGQLDELYERMVHVDFGEAATESRSLLARVTLERDRALQENASLRTSAAALEQEVDVLRNEVERSRVSFADHQATKQELARLREEIQDLTAEP